VKKIIIIVLLLIMPVTSYALDKKIGATNSFKIGIFDTSSKANGGAGRTYNTDFVVKVKCGSGSVVTIDGTGDTITDEGGGYYSITTNDTLTANNEDECLVWAEGAGSYANLIAKMPVKFKAVSNTTSQTTCSITAATSGLSFTISSCKDNDGSSITPATDMFVGSYMVAYTRSGTQCNVVGHGVFVGSLDFVSSAWIVTVKDSDLPGSGFPATPNTSNCAVRISP
jgi:hypothetical protein